MRHVFACAALAAIVFAGSPASAADAAPPAPACPNSGEIVRDIPNPIAQIIELSRVATAAWGTPCQAGLVDAAGAAASNHIWKGPGAVKQGTLAARRPDAAPFAEAAIMQRARQGGAPIGGFASGIPGAAQTQPAPKPAAVPPAAPAGLGGLLGK